MCKMEQRGDEICCFNIKKKKKVRKTNMLEFAVKLLVDLQDSAFLWALIRPEGKQVGSERLRGVPVLSGLILR